MTIFLGCYTDATHANGLKALELDVATGKMSVVAEYRVSNALYQALSPDGRWLYSCSGEGLAAFDLSRIKCCQSENVAKANVSSDQLELDIGLGTRRCVCHVAAMPGGKRVVFADYLGGFAGSVAVEGGKFGEPVIHRHNGSGPNLPRQDAAHCHQAIPLPDGSGYAVCDLGLDEIVEYPSGRVFKTTPAGAGPRHLLFHPNGRLAFLVSELGSLITSLSWSPADGFRTLYTLSTVAKSDAQIKKCCNCENVASTNANDQLGIGNTGIGNNSTLATFNLAAAIRFTPDLKRVVVSNRGENSLVAFDFDEATGRLSFKARTLLSGSWPRDFVFVNDTLALVALERSGEVHALSYNPGTSMFTRLSILSGLFRPVALTPHKTSLPDM